MNTIKQAWCVLFLAVAMLAGCPDTDPAPYPGDTRQTCAQMGYRCGFDDYGASCGNCGAGTTCNGSGVCTTTGTGPCVRQCGGRTCGNDPVCGLSCGTCSGGQTCSAAGACASTGPTNHTIGAERLPLFSGYRGVTFTVPAAIVAYNVTSPGDTYNVGIFTAAEWTNYAAGGTARAYALRDNVRTAAETATLPAGNYVLGFRCRNLIERCDVTYALGANY